MTQSVSTPAPDGDVDVLSYLPLAKATVQRLHVEWNQRDDALQGALLGLVEAAHRFDSARNTAFGVYARGFVLKGALAGAGHVRRRQLTVVAIDGLPAAVADEATAVADPGFERMEIEEEHAAVRRFAASLDGLDRQIYQGLYVEEMSQAVLASRLGLTPMQLSRAKAKLLQRAEVALRPALVTVAA